MNRQGYLRRSLAGTVVLLFAIVVIVGLLALAKEDNKKAGIITLHVRLLLCLLWESLTAAMASSTIRPSALLYKGEATQIGDWSNPLSLTLQASWVALKQYFLALKASSPALQVLRLAVLRQRLHR